jgi:HPt (histidine-containing phosphotransfer) domain-containing protein
VTNKIALPDALPVIDETVLAREFGDDTEILDELRGLFKQQVADVGAELHAAVAVGDAARLAGAAHQLKGASATYGAPRLAAVCAQLESCGKRADMGEAAEQLAVFADECERLLAELDGLTDP